MRKNIKSKIIKKKIQEKKVRQGHWNNYSSYKLVADWIWGRGWWLVGWLVPGALIALWESDWLIISVCLDLRTCTLYVSWGKQRAISQNAAHSEQLCILHIGPVAPPCSSLSKKDSEIEWGHYLNSLLCLNYNEISGSNSQEMLLKIQWGQSAQAVSSCWGHCSGGQIGVL